MRHVRGLPGVDPDQVGLLGWSQGGWIGAMAASRLPELAFYVNIAAIANPWSEQAQHRFLARLQREGFVGESLEEAEQYFQTLRAVSEFRIGWLEYESVRNRYQDDDWYQKITEIYPFFTYKEYGEALVGWSGETTPETYFRRLARVTVKVVPDTNHGAWIVNGYAFNSAEITRRNPEVFKFITT